MPKSRASGSIKLAALFALQISFIVVLHLLGSIDQLTVDFSNLSSWMDVTSPEIALVASIRILALVFSYWLLGTSLLYMLARAFQIPFLIRTMEFATIPGVRRLIDAGLAATIIGGTVFGGAGAVFAQQHSASKVATPSVESSYQQTRVLYNPTPVGVSEEESPSTDLVNEDVKKVVESPDSSTPAVASEEKVTIETEDGSKELPKSVVDSIQVSATRVTNEPAKDASGNYIPTPVGGGESETPTEDPSRDPLPSETTTTTTTTPKVVTPPPETEPETTVPKTTLPPETTTTTTPPTTTTTPEPEVDVEGKQIEREDAPTPAPAATPTTYTVVSGDNFWKIARVEVERSLGREASNAEVASYWVKLIDANRSAIRSGDPNLIYPGEVFTLPSV